MRSLLSLKFDIRHPGILARICKVNGKLKDMIVLVKNLKYARSILASKNAAELRGARFSHKDPPNSFSGYHGSH